MSENKKFIKNLAVPCNDKNGSITVVLITVTFRDEKQFDAAKSVGFNYCIGDKLQSIISEKYYNLWMICGEIRSVYEYALDTNVSDMKEI